MRIAFHDKLSRMAALAAAAGMCGIFPASSAMAGAIGIGDNEVGGVHVSQGASTTLSENVFEGTGARFFKSGEGSLTVPLSKVNRQLDWNLIALGGTMTVTPGDDATVDVATPPAVLQNFAGGLSPCHNALLPNIELSPCFRELFLIKFSKLQRGI